MGNNHAYPFVWGTTHTLAGTDTVVASGIKFHGLTLAEHAVVSVTPLGAPAGTIYVDKDTTANTVTVKSSAAESIDVDITWMLAYEDLDVDGLYCRGNNEYPMPSLP
jgi:hypothetical protein